MMKNSTRIAALIVLASSVAGCTHTNRSAQQPAGEPMQISPLAIGVSAGGFKPRSYAALTQRSWVLGHLAQRNETRTERTTIASSSVGAKAAAPASPAKLSFRTVVAPAMDPAQFNPNRIQ